MYRVFDTASVEAIVFKVEKHASRDEIEFFEKDSATADPRSTFAIARSTCMSFGDFRIPTVWADQAGEIIELLQNSSLRLGDTSSGFKPMIALQAYSLGKGTPPQSLRDVKNHVFHVDHKLDSTTFPYLEGSDIQRFCVQWSGTFLRHGPFLAEPQTIDRFSGPRIVIREIVAPIPHLLSAAYIEETALYNKSVLHIIPSPGGPYVQNSQAVKALLAILNSTVTSFLLYFTGRKTQRSLFPKIVNDDLRDLPLPKKFQQHINALAETVDAIHRMTLSGSKCSLENELLLDHQVALAYGIDPEKYSQMKTLLS